jgi:fluoride exporter
MARPMQTTFLVMAGGAIGAAARYHSGLAVAAVAGERWPWATFAVNIVGAFLIGLLAGWAMARSLPEAWRLFVGVGILGGFTTFSAFSFELWRMTEQGAWLSAVGYATASVLTTFFCVAGGVAAIRAVLA